MLCARLFFTACCVLSLFTGSSFASSLSLADQRVLFKSVERSLERGKSSQYQQHKKALSDYPLAGHLDYLYLSKNFSRLSQKDIDAFVTANPNLPEASRLQFKWLNWLGSKKRWKAYLQAHDVATNSMGHELGARYQCFKGRALLQTGDKEAAWESAENLWLVGESQSKACDPLFQRWKKAGQLTDNLAYQRFWLAVANGKTSLARYIGRSISKPRYKKETELFWQVYRQPLLLKKTSLLDGSRDEHRQIMLSGIKRLISRDRNKALDLWLALREQHPFTPEVVATIDKRLALKFAKRFTENAEAQIARIDPGYQYPEVTKWRVRLALEKQDWEAVRQGILKLPQAERERDSWKYWREVAKIKLSFETDSQQSEGYKALEKLRQERSFYGFLVADLTDKPFQLNHEEPSHSPSDVQQLMNRHKGFSRIGEWLELGRLNQIQSELNRIKPKLSASDRKLLPYVAQELGWHHQAIMAAAREAMWNDLKLRFPSPQEHLFSRYAQKRGVDYSWVISIARQESAFNPVAHSHAGARGLMQLIPSTAKQVARKKQIPYRRASELYQPEKNIALGTAHLAWLSGLFDENRVFATAAYNAGSSAVRRWLKARGHLPLDIWIETIPYDETRRYVKNVLAFRVIYSLREQGQASMFTPDETLRLALTPAEQMLIASYP